MIIGYNTDIKRGGTVYHVQTEDGGEEHPVIVSLVYQGGRILASRKTNYTEILGTEGFLTRLRIMLEDQHRAMIRAVKTGSISASTPPAPSVSAFWSPPPEPPPPDKPADMKSPDTAPGPTRSPEPFREKNLDQVILEYLASEMDEE
ncbi:MAG: hypothetical protein GXP52_00400 [Deltaproteobacteria bacterium]|nr:hypothetical protein [Deltaproteobacteria bacterium]